MRIAIQDIDVTAYDCYRAVIAIIANHYGVPYQMISMGRWGFDYISSTDCLIGKMLNPHTIRKNNFLADSCGISVEKFEDNEVEIEKKIISVIWNGSPIIACSDLYECPWSDAYKKYHFQHFFLIVGYDMQKQILICDDPYFKIKNLEYGLDTIISIVKNYRTLNVYKKAININDIVKQINYDVNYYTQSATYLRIAQYSYDIEKKLNIKEELSGFNSDLYAVPLLDSLRIIATNRLGYAYMVRYFFEKYKLFKEETIISIESCAKLWFKIRTMMIKLCVIPERSHNTERIVECIKEVNELEYKIWNDIGNECRFKLTDIIN